MVLVSSVCVCSERPATLDILLLLFQRRSQGLALRLRSLRPHEQSCMYLISLCLRLLASGHQSPAPSCWLFQLSASETHYMFLARCARSSSAAWYSSFISLRPLRAGSRAEYLYVYAA